MTTTVCMAVPSTLGRTGHGAYLWIFINWALGLRDAGCRVFWLESVSSSMEGLAEDELRPAIADLEARLAPFGLADDFVLVSFRNDTLLHPPSSDEVFEADLLLNFVYGAPERFVRRFPRSALIDIDPGLLQIWMDRRQIEVSPHDRFFTIGETVGTEVARFPTCGIDWHYTAPPVYLPAWPLIPPRPGGRYTTVTGWWDEWMEFEGETFSNEKRTAFLEYVDLPARSPADLELAIIIDKETARRDVPLLEQHGWSVTESRRICDTPEHFRRYVQDSRGEFTRARPSSARLGTTWIGDRTLCYLASGRPAVVEAAASGRCAFDDGGLHRFSTMDEAARALAEVESDYDRHCRRARQIAEERFDATVVAGAVVERALP